jgi:hypothetical protein
MAGDPERRKSGGGKESSKEVGGSTLCVRMTTKHGDEERKMQRFCAGTGVDKMVNQVK